MDPMTFLFLMQQFRQRQLEQERIRQFEEMSQPYSQTSDTTVGPNREFDEYNGIPKWMRNYLAPRPNTPTQPNLHPRQRMGVPSYGIRG